MEQGLYVVFQAWTRGGLSRLPHHSSPVQCTQGSKLVEALLQAKDTAFYASCMGPVAGPLVVSGCIERVFQGEERVEGILLLCWSHFLYVLLCPPRFLPCILFSFFFSFFLLSSLPLSLSLVFFYFSFSLSSWGSNVSHWQL